MRGSRGRGGGSGEGANPPGKTKCHNVGCGFLKRFEKYSCADLEGGRWGGANPPGKQNFLNIHSNITKNMLRNLLANSNIPGTTLPPFEKKFLDPRINS